MINEKLLKQKLLEKSIIENKLLVAYRLNYPYLVRELIYDLMLVENKIKELQRNE